MNYFRSSQGRRLFRLDLGPVALALCAATRHRDSGRRTCGACGECYSGSPNGWSNVRRPPMITCPSNTGPARQEQAEGTPSSEDKQSPEEATPAVTGTPGEEASEESAQH
jgi:hypothetical protein